MGKSEVKSVFVGFLVLLTLILAGVTIVAAFSNRVSPAESTVMPILGMAMPVLLVINLIVGILWLWSGRKRWAIIPLIAYIGSWQYVTATVQFNISPEKRPDGKYLKVATYNVAHFRGEFMGYSCKEIAKYMKQEGVDVLCFQEFGGNRYYPTDSICNVLKGNWPYYLTPTDTLKGVLGIGLFSRYPLVNDRLITYEKSGNCSMLCDVVMGADTVRIINNHLQTTSVSQKRRKWAREMENREIEHEVNTAKEAAETLHGNFLIRAQQTAIIDECARESPYPVVLCGDFNSLPSSYTYYMLSKDLKDGFRTAGHGYMYTYRNGKRLMRIDYLFHSPALKGIDYYSPNLDLCSDHNPAILEVELP